jgi:uncharacterized lipoprotein YddW (UPF0748 family)
VPAGPAQAGPLVLPPSAAAPPAEPDRALPAPLTPPAPPAIRALWVDAFHHGIKRPAQVDELVDTARRAGANTLLVQVRRRGDAYYLRTGEPRTEDPALAEGFDALQAVIARAHSAQPRLEVHAWIATVALWNKERQAPANPEHAFNRHGPDAPEPDNWLSLNDRGRAWDGDNYMLDPGHPAAARYVVRVAEELARNYDVDGVHLDLVRYAGAQWGYNPTSLARFGQRFGLASVPRPSDAPWQQWRRDQVTALVRRVYLDCLAVRPSLKVSAAVIGWGNGPVDDATWRGTSAYRNVFQDWKAWLDEGIVDLAMPMNYDDDANETQRAWFDRWIAWQRESQGKRQVAAGIGMFLNSVAGGVSQIRRALAPSPAGAALAGVALYSYAVSNAPPPGAEEPATPNERLFGVLAGLPDGAWPAGGESDGAPFAGQAPLPPMPWKELPAALVRGVVTRGGEPLDGATIRLDGPMRLALVADGAGYFGATDLAPGVYTLTPVHGGVAHPPARVALTAGRVTTVDLPG